MSDSTGGVVVGIDGSAHADSALLWAWFESQSREVPLTAVCAGAGADGDSSGDDVVSGAIDRLRARLEPALRAGDADPGLALGAIRTAVVDGPAVPALLSFAEDADMLVVGRRGLGRLGRLFMGSVSSGLAREAQIPVTIVPSGWDGSPQVPADDSAHSPSEQARPRIVVGVDGSAASKAGLEHGVALAQRTGNVLEAVSCWQIMSVGALPHGQGWIPPIEDYQDHVATMLEDALTEALENAGGLDRARARAVVEHALPARGLLMHAEGADRLIVGHRGLGGFDRLLLGSVSSQLIEHAPCPVTVIRAS